jgi:hypothetical protein
LAIEGLRRRTGRQITSGLGNIARAFAHRNYLVYVSSAVKATAHGTNHSAEFENICRLQMLGTAA